MRPVCFLVVLLFQTEILAQTDSVVNSFILEHNFKRHELGEQLRKRGIDYVVVGNYSQAESFYNHALELFEEDADSIGIGKTWNNLAYIELNKNNIKLAYEYYLKALALFTKLGDVKSQAMVSINVAGLYYRHQEFNKAVEYYYKAEQLLISVNDPIRKANVKMGLGNILSSKEYQGYNPQMAIDVFSDALNIYLQLGDSSNIPKAYNNIARLFDAQNQLDAALSNYHKALHIYNSINDKNGQIIASLNIGNILKKQRKPHESLGYLKAAEQLAIEIGDAPNYLHILSNLVDVTASLNKIDTMTIYLERYRVLKDSLFNEEKQRQITELQTIYETEQKEKALLVEKKANEEMKTMLRWLAFLAISLVMAIGSIIYQNRKRRISELLTHKKEQEIIALNAHVTGQEEERTRIAKDLHDRMGSLINSAKMMHSQYANKGDDLGNKVDGLLKEASETLREVSHDLASATLIRFGLVKALESYFDTLNKAGKLHADFTTQGLQQRLPQVVERVLDFCIRELVNNTLKYARASQIELQILKDEDNSVLVTYEDDGEGFDLNEVEYGIGLKSIASRIESIMGAMQIDSHPGQGISVVMQIPVKYS